MSSVTNVKLGHGSTVRIGRGATPTWTALVGFDTVSFPAQPRADVDTTHSQSPNATEESIPGLRSGADFTLNLHYVQGGAIDVLLSDLEDTGELVLLEITPAGAGSTAVEWQAYVKEWTPTLPTRDKQTANLVMRIQNKVV
jgi:hypothetical protein